MMETDFYDAFVRHGEDAEVLYQNSRWANCDHLIGLSCECGLKRLMQCFGMTMSGELPSDKADRIHIDKLWHRYENYRSGASATQYILPPSSPFANWSIHQRYASRADFNQELADLHRNALQSIKV